MVGRAALNGYRAGMEDASPQPYVLESAVPLGETPAFWFRLFNEIGIINQLSTASLENALPDGLKAADFRVLNHFVRLGGPRTPVRLARSFQVTKGTMTHTLQKMRGLGLITIAPHGDDGRSKIVDITQTGREAHAKTLQQLLPAMDATLGSVDPTVQEALRQALPALVVLRETLDKARD